MTQIRVDAVIGLQDRLTGPLRALASRVDGIGRGVGRFGAGDRNLSTNMAIGMGGVLATQAFLLRGREDIDRSLRNFSVVAGDVVGDQRERLRAMVMEMGPRLGIAQLDTIRGATDAMQAGLSSQDLFAPAVRNISLLERLASAARVANEPMGKLSSEMVQLATAFNLPWDKAEDRARTMERLMGLAIYAPNLSPDSTANHIRSLLQFGPVFASLGGSVEQASALQNALSAGGFPGARAGYALTTIMARLQNPTVRAQMQMSMAMGADGQRFNYEQIMGGDVSRINPARLVQALRTGGIDTSGGQVEQLVAQAIAGGTGGDVIGWKTTLTEKLAKALKMGKGDVRNRGLLRTAVDNMIATSNAGISVAGMLENFGRLPPSAFKDIAGINRMPQAQVLALQRSLINYAEFLRKIEDKESGASTALDRGMGIRAGGWAASLDRARGSLETFQNALWTKGGGEVMWIAAVDKMASALNTMSGLDSASLTGIFAGLTAVGTGSAGLIALGLTLSGIAFSLTAIATHGPVALALFGGTAMAGRERSAAERLRENMRGNMGMSGFDMYGESAFPGQNDSTFTRQQMPWLWRGIAALGDWLQGGALAGLNGAPVSGPGSAAPATVNINVTGLPAGSSVDLASSPAVQLNRGVSMPDTGSVRGPR